MESLRSRYRKAVDRIVGDPLPDRAVAAGWALGMFIGCAIPFGFQLVVSVPLALVLRVSKAGATLGTFITNPLTIFVIYPVQTFVANRLFFGGTLSLERLRGIEWTWESVSSLGTETIVSFFVGGIVNAFVLAPLTYFAVLRIVRAHRARSRR